MSFLIANLAFAAPKKDPFNCQDSLFPYQNQTRELTETIQKTKEKFRTIYRNYQELTQTQLAEIAVNSFGKMTPLKYQIITHRLYFTNEMLNNFSLKSIRSIDWGINCHPNQDFEYTAPLDLYKQGKIYALVNYYGEQKVDAPDFIDDLHIYIGTLFMERSDERVITLLHELSHLSSFPADDVISNPNNLMLYNAIPTVDYYLEAGDPKAIFDAYVWEIFLESLANL